MFTFLQRFIACSFIAYISAHDQQRNAVWKSRDRVAVRPGARHVSFRPNLLTYVQSFNSLAYELLPSRHRWEDNMRKYPMQFVRMEIGWSKLRTLFNGGLL